MERGGRESLESETQSLKLRRRVGSLVGALSVIEG